LAFAIGCAAEHDFCQLEAQDIVGFSEQGCCIGAGIKNVPSHSYELGGLSEKHKLSVCDGLNYAAKIMEKLKLWW
jgi:hypothetical protein